MSAVFICTKQRFGNLMKVVPRWLDTTPRHVPVILVTDKSEAADTKSLIAREQWPDRVWVYRLREDNAGIGFARHEALRLAGRKDYVSIIMADDDIMPKHGVSVNPLLRVARRDSVLGIGATRSYHDWLSNGVTGIRKDPILCPSGWGFQLFALNVQNTLSLGNYDPRLDCFGEDAELMRRGISAGIPWLVHCGVKCETIGNRHAPGGIASLTATPVSRSHREAQCQRIIHDMWPEFTSCPPKPSRMAWGKMYDRYIPGWRERSAIHGGSL
jgi:hypothetical protein